MTASWPIESLGDICKFKYGKSLKSDDRVPGVVEVMGSNGRVGWHDQSITAGPTVVVGRKGSIGQIAYSRNTCWPIDTTYYIDSSTTKQDLRWLYWTLQSVGLTGMNKSAAVPGLNREDAYRVRIPLPPLPEQRRIADILDRADNLRAQRRRALVQLDSLRDSLFFHTFGAGIDVPSGTISDLLSLRSGKFLPASAMNSGGDVSVYGGNGVNGTHDQHLFDSPQIVIGRVGAYCGAVHVTTTRSWVTDNAMVVGWDLAVFERDYLAAALAKANLNQFASQSGQPLLSASKLANVAIPIPTLDLQREFGERMTYLDGVRLRHQDHLVKLEELFASLQHRAFQGEF